MRRTAAKGLAGLGKTQTQPKARDLQGFTPLHKEIETVTEPPCGSVPSGVISVGPFVAGALYVKQTLAKKGQTKEGSGWFGNVLLLEG